MHCPKKRIFEYRSRVVCKTFLKLHTYIHTINYTYYSYFIYFTAIIINSRYLFCYCCCFKHPLYCAKVMQTIIVDYLRIFIFLVDVCHHYQNLTNAERKYDHVTVKYKCDDTLNGWYRFQGAAGKKMATACPPVKRCDVDYPAWLSEDHPTVAEGTVTRKVCIHNYVACCDKSVFIQVKNCSSYYIYKLRNPVLCDTRYCGTD